jgi:serine/threonine-protein kinase
MATVFLARLEGVAGFQRLFAIKRLHPHLAKEAEFVDMFLDEARLAARIHHPNVVPILEVGNNADGYYLVMEYIEGDTAARLLARSSQAGTRIPAGAAVRIALDTLFGLHAAHDLTDDEGRPLHIVHRDVSPQNILVGIDGVSRITDFGVAHAASRLSSTRTGQLKGKLAYMAPEQARGAIVDRRSDVFAMGVVLWEMLAGKRLFKASNDAETLQRILFAPLPTIRSAGVDVPVPLETVAMRALSREPEQRYASAADFADELERVARSLEMLATTREIASYVDGTIGAEISQQREIVRGWLARSEPSRNDRISLPLSPDARRSGRPNPDDSAMRAAMRAPSSRDVTLSAPGKRDVSSVSSAVLEMPDATTTDSRILAGGLDDEANPFRSRLTLKRKAVLWAVVGGVGVGLASVFAIALWPSSRAVGVRAAGSASMPPVPVVVATAPLPPAPTAAPFAIASPSASAAATPAIADAASSARRTTRPPTPVRSGPPVRPAHPQAAPPSDDLSDDVSKNPYR